MVFNFITINVNKLIINFCYQKNKLLLALYLKLLLQIWNAIKQILHSLLNISARVLN